MKKIMLSLLSVLTVLSLPLLLLVSWLNVFPLLRMISLFFIATLLFDSDEFFIVGLIAIWSFVPAFWSVTKGYTLSSGWSVAFLITCFFTFIALSVHDPFRSIALFVGFLTPMIINWVYPNYNSDPVNNFFLTDESKENISAEVNAGIMINMRRGAYLGLWAGLMIGWGIPLFIFLLISWYSLDEFAYYYYEYEAVGASLILAPFGFVLFGGLLGGLFRPPLAWYVTWMTGRMLGALFMFLIFYKFPSLKQRVALVGAISGVISGGVLAGIISLTEQDGIGYVFIVIIFCSLLGFAFGKLTEYIAKRRGW